jgi:A/G-specific adenine glycosylase
MFTDMMKRFDSEGFRLALLRWFRAVARPLPWRVTRHPYHVWLSEIILQQTRVAQGLPYYERILAAYPDVNQLAAAAESDLLRLWEGLGYYSRARNLLKAARMISDEKDGVFPATAGEWAKLPGVGRYTANAITSIAFDEPVAVLDGNVKRVLSRLFDLDGCIDDAAVTTDLWGLAQELLDVQSPGDFNQAMMELGATICQPGRPRCEGCPVAEYCRARESGTETFRPVRAAKPERPHMRMAGLVLRDSRKRFLLVRRPSSGLLGGLWEFPVLEMDAGEMPADALIRAGRELLAVGLVPGVGVADIRQVYTHFSEEVCFHECRLAPGERIRPAKLSKYVECQWITADGLGQYALTRVARRVADILSRQ